ncbi:MAG: N-acetylneuraminate synthase family protein [Acidobacteria bacterium]|nr:N-acetylneuraminate synthase family protein [Acidobacteriota bacterium]
MSFRVANSKSQDRCLIVAEVAQAHDGSLGMAHAFIDAIANAGADAVKFQTHIAAAESTPAEPWRVKFSRQDETRYDYWKRMEFTEAQWQELKVHAHECGLKFLSSPFSIEAVALLERVGVAAWKVASGEISNAPMFESMVATRLPVILSSGMSPWSELDAAVKKVQDAGLDLTLLQCSSVYPTPSEKLGLNLLSEFRKRYGCKVGLSDHSGTVFAGLAAVALEAEMIEVHVTFSRESFGPDVPASLTLAELRQLVDGCRFIRDALNHPVDKNQMAAELAPMRGLFTRSIVARTQLPAGTALTAEHVTLKKPGTGIPAQRFNEVLGRQLSRAVPADALITENDLVPVGEIGAKATENSPANQPPRGTTT